VVGVDVGGIGGAADGAGTALLAHPFGDLPLSIP